MIEVHAHIYSAHLEMMGDINENQDVQICQQCGDGFRTIPLLANHIRSKHLSISQKISGNHYENIIREFGDHIVEHNGETEETVRKIHSIFV